MKKKIKVIRQGDVCIRLNSGKPADAIARKDRTLALGEATGHHHTLTAGIVYGAMDGVQWIVADEPVELRHQEHEVVTIPAGIHEVYIQREYTPAAVRRVVD